MSDWFHINCDGYAIAILNLITINTFFTVKMPLLIVETPAKCKKIQGFLGSNWQVIATMGHIRALEEDITAVGLDRDFDPRYKWLHPEKTRAITQIRETAAKFSPSDIYLASDDDREGEAISYSVAQLLRLDPTKTPRAVFHEITSKAVKDAVTHPRLIDMNRVYAQQARAMLDMMIGSLESKSCLNLVNLETIRIGH